MPAPAALPAGAAACRTPVILAVGMAGSGKTTLVNALACYLDDHALPALGRAEAAATAGAGDAGSAGAAPTVGAGGESAVREVSAATSAASAAAAGGRAGDADGGPPDGAYVVNLDPAVAQLPYEPNVDIRDTVKYKDVMREYRLGPNGAIITSLNLFATRFDQVLALVQRRAPEVHAIVVDTPGQIETFTWSASGAIITEALSSVLPTVVLFVVDTPRSANAMTFVSNMLYACSIMYKTRLPLVVVFNKIDVKSSAFAEAWMRDFDAFDAALREDNFAGTLARSMAQALEEFYCVMRCASVSAVTEEGLDSLMAAVTGAAAEYEREYRPALERKRAELACLEGERKAAQLAALRADIDSERVGPSPGVRDSAWAPAVDEDGGDYLGRDLLEPPGTGDADAPGTGARKMQAMRSGGGNEDGDDDEVDHEDAAAYADLVRYLQALKTSPAAADGSGSSSRGGGGGAASAGQ
jgi:GPN-loop GTPase